MKRIIPFLLAAFTAGATQTNLYQVDLTTTQTNVTSSTALISITNVCTNAVYFSVNSNTIVIGDSLPTAFNKVNSNSVWITSRFTNDEAATGSLRTYRAGPFGVRVCPTPPHAILIGV